MNRREKIEKAIMDKAIMAQRQNGNAILIPKDKLEAMQKKINQLEAQAILDAEEIHNLRLDR